MSGPRDEREVEAEQLAARTRELAKTHQELRARRAGVGDLSAAVHDQAARVHAELGSRSLLDPEVLRDHAERNRQMAAEERAALAEEQAADQPTSGPGPADPREPGTAAADRRSRQAGRAG